MPCTTRRVSRSTMIAISAHVPGTPSRCLPSPERDPIDPELSVLDPVGEEPSDPPGLRAGGAGALEPRLEFDVPLAELLLFHLEAGAREEGSPLLGRVVPHVGGIPQTARLLVVLAHPKVVDDEDALFGDTRHLTDPGLDIPEVVGREPAGHGIEARIIERQLFRRADDVRLHARRRIGADHLESCLPKSPGHVPASGRDVERGLAAGRPLHEEVEVPALAVLAAPAVSLRPLVPYAHRDLASSTTRSAAESIVSSTCRFGGAASASMARPSSAFVPSSRTTIGRSIVMRSSASRIPRATSSPRVMPPKMLKTIPFTWGSAVITSSASTTPWASPPPPRSQK